MGVLRVKLSRRLERGYSWGMLTVIRRGKARGVTDKSKDKRVTDKTHNTVNDFEGTVS